MSGVFTKELPQSSLMSYDEEDEERLCIEKFTNPPRTLYDEIGHQEHDVYISPKSEIDWQNLVNILQAENASLLNSLQEANDDLMQSRREKEELEDFIQRQTESTDNIVSRLKDTVTNLIENQKEEHLKYEQLLSEKHDRKDTNDRVLDLIFQKNYIMMENEALKESQQEINDYYGIKPRLNQPSGLFKWRSCVYALIALSRFQNALIKQT